MGIRHLKIFQTVCEEGSVTKAAQKLYMTQPAVSHAIKELELEKGFPLFDRISGKLYLTEAGATLLEKATVVLELYGEIESMAANSLHCSHIRVGSCITIACYWLPLIIRQFYEQPQHREIQITTQVAAADGVINMLKTNQIDLALLEGPYLLERCHLHPFSSYRIIAVCSPLHPFATGASIPLDRLLEEPLLLREKGSAIRDPFDSLILLRKQTVSPLVTSVNSQALLQMAKANIGVALLADRVALPEIEAGNLCRVNVPELNITNDVSIAFHERKHLSASLEKLIGFIRAAGSSL